MTGVSREHAESMTPIQEAATALRIWAGLSPEGGSYREKCEEYADAIDAALSELDQARRQRDAAIAGLDLGIRVHAAVNFDTPEDNVARDGAVAAMRLAAALAGSDADGDET